MRVVIDPEVCQGHGLCVGRAPEVFRMNEREHAEVIGDDVPPELEAAARECALLCPEQAITIS